MKLFSRRAVFVAVLTTTDMCVGQEPVDKERAKLVGVWVGYAVKGKGENPERGGVKIELIITKDTIKGVGFKGKERVDLGIGTYQLKLDKMPFQMDGDKKLDNPNRKEIHLGIYQLDGDSLKWRVGRKERPTEFDGKDDAFLLILKRQAK
ncbi:MAG: TIGR03067 domain-containing protein [Planctomycetes bacterium]|nr:TIGR03067 domain-containing protein [Planctomycetota bacterium]